MKIAAALAAALDTLAETLDEPGTDITRTLHELTLFAAAAVPTYLGLSMVVSDSDPPFSVTTLVDGMFACDICTSLQVLLPAVRDGRDSAPVALILYASAPGTFVDLAADLAWSTFQSPSNISLDQHLTIAASPDDAIELQAASQINQAIGVLIGRGYTPQQADRQLDSHAPDTKADRDGAAHRILSKVATTDWRGYTDL